MARSRRLWLGLSGLLSAGLAVVVLRDVFVDWRVEGKPLALTLAENALPFILAVAVGVAAYVVSDRRDGEWTESVSRWQLVGAAGLFVIALEVVGLQTLQGELKPRLIVVQMTIGGAVAGTLVGYANARSAETRQVAERERDKFESLFDNAPAEGVEVALADDAVVIQEANAAFREMFGVEGDPEGAELFEVVEHGEGTAEDVREALAAEETLETELRTETATGKREFQLRAIPYGGGGTGFLLYTDVTELREAQTELEQTVSRLTKSNERLQQFAYVASHDLQEPARMVSSYVSLLDREYGDQLNEEAQEYMHFAVDGADRMQAMIDGLLDYSRVRTQAEEFTDTDAEAVFQDTMQDLELLVEDHDVTVTHDDLPTVEADRNQLSQVFQNLLENAIQHGGREIHVGAERDGREVVFMISDDGPGIPENRQDRIFEIFEQGDRDNEGTGIGLAICDRIVSRHSGEMWVESSDREGATLYFSMPAADE